MNGHGAKGFFTDAERERIRQAVVEAEASTAGEIATMVIEQSDFYHDGEVLGAILLSGIGALIVAIASHHTTVWSYVPLVFLLFYPARLLFRAVPRLKLPFVNRRRLIHAVRDRAVRAFYEKGLYKTREETGVLIFISLLERKVWILGDRGINSRIAPHFWHGLAGDLTRGIRAGRGCEALCDVIGRCGAELARHFPRAADDRNELPDEVLA